MSSCIKALKIGSRAREIVNAQSGILKVHSVFKHAVNFIDNGDYLITFLEKRYGCSSQVITIGSFDLSRLVSIHMACGDVIDLKDFIVLDGAEEVDFALKAPLNHLHCSLIRKNVEVCRKYLLGYGKLSGFAASFFGFQNIYSKNVIEGLRSFEYAFLNKNEKEMAEALKGFIGLGQGLTPSGDDFICGLISALFYFSSLTKVDKNWTKSMGQRTVEEAKTKTTLISYNMLRAYVNGELSEHMQDFLSSMLTCEDERLILSFNRILQIGSTSGSDMAAGVLYGFHLMDKAGGFEPH